jgi:hypothetical protein
MLLLTQISRFARLLVSNSKRPFISTCDTDNPPKPNKPFFLYYLMEIREISEEEKAKNKAEKSSDESESEEDSSEEDDGVKKEKGEYDFGEFSTSLGFRKDSGPRRFKEESDEFKEEAVESGGDFDIGEFMLKAEEDNAVFNLEESVAEAPVSDDNNFRGGDFYSVNSSNDFYSKSGSNIYGGGSSDIYGASSGGGYEVGGEDEQGSFYNTASFNGERVGESRRTRSQLELEGMKGSYEKGMDRKRGENDKYTSKGY